MAFARGGMRHRRPAVPVLVGECCPTWALGKVPRLPAVGRGFARGAPLEESQNKHWGGCPLFFIRGKDQDIERLKRGGCYEREKQRGKGKQEGAAEKPQREEKGEEREAEQVGLEEALEVTS